MLRSGSAWFEGRDCRLSSVSNGPSANSKMNFGFPNPSVSRGTQLARGSFRQGPYAAKRRCCRGRLHLGISHKTSRIDALADVDCF